MKSAKQSEAEAVADLEVRLSIYDTISGPETSSYFNKIDLICALNGIRKFIWSYMRE
jgi:hypothetical protein